MTRDHATWRTALLTNKNQILAYLETDRSYAGYAIGDLEPGLYEQSTWAGARRDGRLAALVLYYRGLDIPALFLMGEAAGLQAILADTLHPERVYLTCLRKHLPLIRRAYAWEKMDRMWRMVLRPEEYCPVPGHPTRLSPQHAPSLRALYAHGPGNAFHPAQVAQGVFYGVFCGTQLVAAAGTHLVSPTYGVAAVGNILTHPDHRGRGHASACTSAVVAELLHSGIRDLILNVQQSNERAIRVYERLGFLRHCAYLEGPAHAISIAT
jgi:ribosomal protein S18 acetylase RimI-like enzyme